MPGPNLRDLVGDIREAVERLPREALVEILVYVFKEYVVEGPAPLATPATLAATEAAHDLEGMSFAEVVRSLQLRLDLPELEQLEVQGERVLLRSGGRLIPIEPPAGRAEPSPPASTSSMPAGPASPSPPGSIQAASAPTPTASAARPSSPGVAPSGRAPAPGAASAAGWPGSGGAPSVGGPAFPGSPGSGAAPSGGGPASPPAPGASPPGAPPSGAGGAKPVEGGVPPARGGLLEID